MAGLEFGGFGFRVLGVRVWGLGFRVLGLGFWVLGMETLSPEPTGLKTYPTPDSQDLKNANPAARISVLHLH